VSTVIGSDGKTKVRAGSEALNVIQHGTIRRTSRTSGLGSATQVKRIAGHSARLDVATLARRGILYGFIALMAGCEPEGHVPIVSVSDSAGVQLIESARATWAEGEAWVVGVEPLQDLTTTGEGAAHEFYRVVDGRRLPDGDLVIAMPTELRYYSSSGEHRLTLGRTGDGPGEFRRIAKIGVLPPDSLVVYDRALRRITVYGPDRRPARVISVDIDPAATGDEFAVLGSGFVLMEYRGPFAGGAARTGVIREPAPVLALSPDGEVLDTLMVAAGFESAFMGRDGGFTDAAAVLGRRTHLAVFGTQLLVGDAIDFEYTVRNGDGVLLRIVRGAKDLALRPEAVEAEFEARYGPDPSPSALELINDFPRPDRMPAYRDLRVDATGAVWLAEHLGRAVFEVSTEPNAWEVFDSEGRWLGQVHTPGRFQVLEIGPDYVLGVRKDQLDVEHVQFLPLRR